MAVKFLFVENANYASLCAVEINVEDENDL